jgi:hypothetical protein
MYEIKRELERLDWESKKYQEVINQNKQRMIDEIKSYDKSKMFNPIPKKKTSFFKKILIALEWKR